MVLLPDVSPERSVFLLAFASSGYEKNLKINLMHQIHRLITIAQLQCMSPGARARTKGPNQGPGHRDRALGPGPGPDPGPGPGGSSQNPEPRARAPGPDPGPDLRDCTKYQRYSLHP